MSGREVTDALLAELPMSDDGTGHVADCGYNPDSIRPCDCSTLPERLGLIVAAREAALAERITLAIEAEREDAAATLDDQQLYDRGLLYGLAVAARIAREIGGTS